MMTNLDNEAAEKSLFVIKVNNTLKVVSAADVDSALNQTKLSTIISDKTMEKNKQLEVIDSELDRYIKEVLHGEKEVLTRQDFLKAQKLVNKVMKKKFEDTLCATKIGDLSFVMTVGQVSLLKRTFEDVVRAIIWFTLSDMFGVLHTPIITILGAIMLVICATDGLRCALTAVKMYKE